jgi:cytochrome c
MDRAALALVAAGIVTTSAAADDGDAARGARLFGTCAACHALQPDRNMTGPSLAGLWNRKAGTLTSFHRYSPALKAADVVWAEQTLEPFLQDPAKFIPGNRMTFPGIKDDRARLDLIAFLKQSTGSGQARQSPPDGQMGGMTMGGQSVPNLKKVKAEERVQAITYCGDTYRVTTADGQTQDFWERNLRFKTDSGAEGPEKGAPAILGAGMMGDRASVIFAAPEEISGFIKSHC